MTRIDTCFRTGLTVLGAAVVLAGCGAQPDAAHKPIAIVDTQTVAFEQFSPQLALTGVVQARSETQLAFRLAGQIKERLVDVGDHVTAGQRLASIDDAGQQADVQAAEAALAAANAQVQVAQAAFDRQDSLLKQGVTTRSSFDAAQTALQTSNGSRDAAQAQLDTAREALTYTSLLAPAAGVVTERNIEVGEVAQAAAPVFALAEDGPRDAVFNVQEAIFLGKTDHVQIGLSFTGDPAITATGTLREVSPALDPKTGTVQVKVAIDNPSPAMTLGRSVTGTVVMNSGPKAVLPWSALWSSNGEPAVWIVDPQSQTVSLQPVTISTYQTGNIVLDDGLQEGQVVVTQGTKMLVPGQVVTVAGGSAS